MKVWAESPTSRILCPGLRFSNLLTMMVLVEHGFHWRILPSDAPCLRVTLLSTDRIPMSPKGKSVAISSDAKPRNKGRRYMLPNHQLVIFRLVCKARRSLGYSDCYDIYTL